MDAVVSPSSCDELAHAWHLARRDGDEDDVDIAMVHEGRDVIEAPEKLRIPGTAKPVAATIIEEAGHRDAELDMQPQALGEFHAGLGAADDDCTARLGCVAQQRAGHSVKHQRNHDQQYRRHQHPGNDYTT